MFGKLLSLPIRLINVPAKAFDRAMNYVCDDDPREEMASRPLSALAEIVEEAVDGDDE